MAIPALDENGLLPVGVHDCTMGEIKTRFGSFSMNDRRPKLFEKLGAFIAEAQSIRIVSYLLIDGSFVTGKVAPNDIDLVLVLPLGHNFEEDLLPGQYNLVSKRRVQRRFGFDIVTVREETVEYDEVVAFFTQVRHAPGLRKGILRVSLYD